MIKGCKCGRIISADKDKCRTCETYRGSESSALMMESSRCLDDCLVLLMPEEYSVEDWIAVQKRVQKMGGRLAYIGTLADKLREMANNQVNRPVKAKGKNHG